MIINVAICFLSNAIKQEQDVNKTQCVHLIGTQKKHKQQKYVGRAIILTSESINTSTC